MFGALILGGGLYLMSANEKKNSKKIPVTAVSEDATFESAEELFPVIEFPPEFEHKPDPELPWGYDDNKIIIMARDPDTIYAYWDISEEKRNSLRDLYGHHWENSLPVLRIYDVTGITDFDGYNANHHYDVVINDYAGSWYLHVGTPNRTFCVDLGRILNDGRYITVARSNLTFTPRNTFSDRTDPEWMLVSENERRLYARIMQADGHSSIELFDRQNRQE
jgi:hypothetical protein